MNEREFWLAIRAAKIQQKNALEQQCRALLTEIAEIEKMLGIKPGGKKVVGQVLGVTVVEDPDLPEGTVRMVPHRSV